MNTTAYAVGINFDKLLALHKLRSKLNSRMRYLVSQCDLVLDSDNLDIYARTKTIDYYLSRKIIYLNRTVNGCLEVKVRIISDNGIFHL